VVGFLNQQGFSEVKANSSGYSPPTRIKWDDKDRGILPDITGEYNGALYVFEIETSKQLQPTNVEDRWKLLSVHARRYNGKFYLVIPEPRADHVQGVAENLDLQPEYLKLRGVENA
jgi:hypothetical protein